MTIRNMIHVFSLLVMSLVITVGFAKSANRTFSDLTFGPGDGRSIYFESSSTCHLVCTVNGVGFSTMQQKAYIEISGWYLDSFRASPAPDQPPYYRLIPNQSTTVDLYAVGDDDDRDSSNIGFSVPEGFDSISVHVHCEVAPGGICPDSDPNSK